MVSLPLRTGTRSKRSRRAEETPDGLGDLRLGLGDYGATRHELAGHAGDERDRADDQGGWLGQVDAQRAVQRVGTRAGERDRRSACGEGEIELVSALGRPETAGQVD